MVSDPDGANPRMKEGGEEVSLAHIFKNYGKYAKHKGVNELVNLLIDRRSASTGLLEGRTPYRWRLCGHLQESPGGLVQI